MGILKLVFLFIAILYTIAITVRLVSRDIVPGPQIVLVAIGIFGFLVLQLDSL